MMKKALLISLLFSFFSLTAQTPSESEVQVIMQKINNLDSLSARQFADEIAFSTKTRFQFYELKTYKKGRILKYNYINMDLSEDQQQKIETYGCDQNCLTVEFKVYYEGGNPDLEIIGEKKIAFSKVGSFRFLDIFPTWKRVFYKNSTEEDVLSFKNNHIYLANTGVFRFQKFNNFWTLKNQSF